jgi:hypothetical protein
MPLACLYVHNLWVVDFLPVISLLPAQFDIAPLHQSLSSCGAQREAWMYFDP